MTWLNLENIMLSERSQTQRIKWLKIQEVPKIVTFSETHLGDGLELSRSTAKWASKGLKATISTSSHNCCSHNINEPNSTELNTSNGWTRTFLWCIVFVKWTCSCRKYLCEKAEKWIKVGLIDPILIWSYVTISMAKDWLDSSIHLGLLVN